VAAPDSDEPIVTNAIDQRCSPQHRGRPLLWNHPRAHFWLAAALAHLGRLDEARSALDAGLALDPTFTIARFRTGAPSDNPTYRATWRRIRDGLRRVGMPEG
jgi:Tetratricopeptide repeat